MRLRCAQLTQWAQAHNTAPARLDHAAAPLRRRAGSHRAPVALVWLLPWLSGMDAWSLTAVVLGTLLVPTRLAAAPADPKAPECERSDAGDRALQPSAPVRSGISPQVPGRAVALRTRTGHDACADARRPAAQPAAKPATQPATKPTTQAARSPGQTAAKTPARPRPLVMPPVGELSRPLATPPALVKGKRTAPPLSLNGKPLPIDGFAAGDFLIQPNITLATDCRYGDPRSRERSWMDELDAQDSRRRGEVRADPVSRFLRGPGQNTAGGSADPGYQVADTVSQRLQPVPSVTAPLRALERAGSSPDGGTTAAGVDPETLRRSVATITRPDPAATARPQQPASRRTPRGKPVHHP